jgi:flagellar hook-basal body complex protein FliE
MNGLTIEGVRPFQDLVVKPETQLATKGFGDVLKRVLADVNSQQYQSDTAMQNIIKGDMDVHEGMMVVSEADLSLRLLLQVRNKVLDAYREISRM